MENWVKENLARKKLWSPTLPQPSTCSTIQLKSKMFDVGLLSIFSKITLSLQALPSLAWSFTKIIVWFCTSKNSTRFFKYFTDVLVYSCFLSRITWGERIWSYCIDSRWFTESKGLISLDEQLLDSEVHMHDQGVIKNQLTAHQSLSELCS